MNTRTAIRIGRAALLLAALHGVAQAEQPLDIRPVGKVKLRIDGDLRDWRGVRFAKLGSDADGSLEYALGYDADALYVGARVHDDDVVRTAHPSSGEDAVVLVLAMPRAGGAPAASEVWLFSGVAGKQAARAAVGSPGARPRNESAITLVEGPLAGAHGYVLEARVPWKAVPGGRDVTIGRGAIRLHDVDGKPGAPAHGVASASGPARSLPPLLVAGSANTAIVDFLRAKQLTSANIRFDLAADVEGDAHLERVVLAGTFAVWSGPEVQGGNGFHYMDLPVTTAAAVREATLRDVTGDGKAELVLRLRTDTDFGERELFEVVGLASGRATPLFVIDAGEKQQGGDVSADIRVGSSRAGHPAPIEVRIGSARGLDAGSYREQHAPGVEPLLVPWGAVARRRYAWDGTRFALADEQANPAHNSAPAPAPAPSPARAQARPHTVEHAAPPGAAELIAAFRKERGIDPALKARFTQHANFAEDGALESLLVFGKDLLLIGKGYRGGSGYFYFSLPAASADDVLRLFTGDVTGDGRRELFVRVRQLVSDVQREILYGYTFTDAGIARILAVEVRRAQDGHSVGNVVALVPQSRHFALRIAPGRAHGWDASSYPFLAGSQDENEPLLLPWRDGVALYHWDGERQLLTHAVP